jgi:hypothetical protein
MGEGVGRPILPLSGPEVKVLGKILEDRTHGAIGIVEAFASTLMISKPRVGLAVGGSS